MEAPCDPTAEQFAALLAAHKAACAAFEGTAEDDRAAHEAAEQAVHRADQAIVAARPTDRQSLLRQLRWIVDDLAEGQGSGWPGGEDTAALQHIVAQLDAPPRT